MAESRISSFENLKHLSYDSAERIFKVDLMEKEEYYLNGLKEALDKFVYVEKNHRKALVMSLELLERYAKLLARAVAIRRPLVVDNLFEVEERASQAEEQRHQPPKLRVVK